ncbi:MAG: hypothetical protein ACKVH8_02220 [Pirellulales bacterium]
MFRFFGIAAIALTMGYMATSVQLPASLQSSSNALDIAKPDWRKTNRGWERAELWNRHVTSVESKIPTPLIHPIPATIVIYALAMLALSGVPTLANREKLILTEQVIVE